MPEASGATLTSLVENGPIKSLRIEAIRKTADSHYLGVVGVSFRHPIRAWIKQRAYRPDGWALVLESALENDP